MPDIRCLLPALPVALIAGAVTAVTFGPGAAVPLEPWAGLAATVATVVALPRVLVGWTERARRWLGYTGAVVVGLATGAVLALLAIGTGLCGTWGEQCSPEEVATMERFTVGALAAPVAVPALYAVLDLATRRPGRDASGASRPRR